MYVCSSSYDLCCIPKTSLPFFPIPPSPKQSRMKNPPTTQSPPQKKNAPKPSKQVSKERKKSQSHTPSSPRHCLMPSSRPSMEISPTVQSNKQYKGDCPIPETPFVPLSVPESLLHAGPFPLLVLFRNEKTTNAQCPHAPCSLSILGSWDLLPDAAPPPMTNGK